MELSCCHKRLFTSCIDVAVLWQWISIKMKGFYRHEQRQEKYIFSHLIFFCFAIFLLKAQEEKFLISQHKREKFFCSLLEIHFFVFFCINAQFTLNFHYFRHSTDESWSQTSHFIIFHFILLGSWCENNFPLHFPFSSFTVSFAKRMTLFDFSTSTWMSIRGIVVLH